MAHAAAIALLITLRFPLPADLPARPRRFALIAPPPSRVPLKSPFPRTSPTPAPPPPPRARIGRIVREFHAQFATAREPTRIELGPISLPGIAPEALPEALHVAPAELPRIARLTPRPIKTGDFDSSAADAHAITAATRAQATKPGATKPGATKPTESFDIPAVSRELDPKSSHPAPARVDRFSDASIVSAASSRRAVILDRAISVAEFSDSSVALNAANAPNASRKPAPPSASKPVEILFKPKPVYTADARVLQIEGEVLLEMQFGAAGNSTVLRIVHGLGHGLDESAITAALEIRFRPAERNGTPVDSAAIVHIVFQLAY